MTNHINSREFLVGAAVGSLLGGVTALLTAPKSGKRLRRELEDVYSDISDKTHDVADHMSKKGRSFAKSFNSNSCDWADKAKCVVNSVRGWCSSDEEVEETHRDLLIGGILGGVLGAVAGLLLAPKSGHEMREDLIDAYGNVSDKTQEMAAEMTKRGKKFAKTASTNTNRWLDFAKDLLGEISGEVQEKGEDLADNAKDKFHDIMDWAALGFRVWQGINKRR